MKRLLGILLAMASLPTIWSQGSIDHALIRQDLQLVIASIRNNYVYLEDKALDLACIQSEYERLVPALKDQQEVILFFEYLLNELYDSHVILSRNTSESYRLYAPVYASLHDGRFIITSIWQSQIDPININVCGAEVTHFNGLPFAEVIRHFPTKCTDASNPTIKEWIANKVLAGRHSEPRILTLDLVNGTTATLNLDDIIVKNDDGLLSVHKHEGVGIIRINNSLGNDDLVSTFDRTLDTLFNTKGLILDLRNTISGGDSYEARGVMSRLISDPGAYQRHAYMARSYGNPDVERSWMEYVSPREKTYHQPIAVLVGRWTGSMGEGLAIGLDGMARAEVVGTEMRRLAGEVNGFRFNHQSFGYQLSVAKLYHVNGMPRETYLPPHYVKQTTVQEDETLAQALAIIEELAR